MTRSYKAEAIVLKRANFSEADRIITVYTKHQGKLTLIAKGVRKLTSRKKGHLELFTQTKLQIAKAKNLDIITEAETINNFTNIRNNLNRTRIAYLLAEITDKLTPEEQPHPELYQLLTTSFTQLNANQASKNLITNFEKQILNILGFGLPTKTTRQNLEKHIFNLTETPLNSKKIK